MLCHRRGISLKKCPYPGELQLENAIYLLPWSKRKPHGKSGVVVGVVFTILIFSFYMKTKYFQRDNFMLRLKGVWQRIYLLDSCVMLLGVSRKMVRQIGLK